MITLESQNSVQKSSEVKNRKRVANGKISKTIIEDSSVLGLNTPHNIDTSSTTSSTINDNTQTISLKNISQVKPIRAKTEEEIKFLEQQFEIDPTWSRKTVQIGKKALNLRTDQIYKWGFDRKKLLEKRGIKLAIICPKDSYRNSFTNQLVEEITNLNTIVNNMVDDLENEEKMASLNTIVCKVNNLEKPAEKDANVTKSITIKNCFENEVLANSPEILSVDSTYASTNQTGNLYEIPSWDESYTDNNGFDYIWSKNNLTSLHSDAIPSGMHSSISANVDEMLQQTNIIQLDTPFKLFLNETTGCLMDDLDNNLFHF